jgi:AraC family transcriptional regulator
MKIATRQYYSEKIAKALNLIQDHLGDPLSFDELARAVNMAPFHFHKVFREIVGIPVQAYIRNLRLDRAADHLTTSGMKILDIAVEAQYQSNEAFTRAFKKAFGVTPSDFRDRAMVPRLDGGRARLQAAPSHPTERLARDRFAQPQAAPH